MGTEEEGPGATSHGPALRILSGPDLASVLNPLKYQRGVSAEATGRNGPEGGGEALAFHERETVITNPKGDATYLCETLGLLFIRRHLSGNRKAVGQLGDFLNMPTLG